MNRFDIQKIEIHGKDSYFIVEDGIWKIIEYSTKKKKYERFETIIAEDRKKKAKKITVEELIAKVQENNVTNKR